MRIVRTFHHERVFDKKMTILPGEDAHVKEATCCNRRALIIVLPWPLALDNAIETVQIERAQRFCNDGRHIGADDALSPATISTILFRKPVPGCIAVDDAQRVVQRVDDR